MRFINSITTIALATISTLLLSPQTTTAQLSELLSSNSSQYNFHLPTAKLFIDNNTLVQVENVAYPLIQSQLSILGSVTIPAQTISQLGNTITLSNITVANTTIPRNSLLLQLNPANNSITASLNDIGVILNAAYAVSGSLLGSGSGTGVFDITGTSVNVPIVFDPTVYGYPNITVGTVSSSIGNINAQFSGSDASLLDSLIGSLGSTVSSSISNGLNSAIQPLINSVVDSYVSSFNLLQRNTTLLNGYTLFNNSLNATGIDTYVGLISGADAYGIKINDNYIEVQSALQFLPNQTYVSNDATHHTIEDTPPYNNTRLISAAIDDYLVNSLLYTLAESNAVSITLTQAQAPPQYAQYLNTALIGQFVPGLTKAYPNNNVSALIQPLAASPPTASWAETNTTTFNIPLNVTLNAVASNGSNPLVSYNLTLIGAVTNITIDNTAVNGTSTLSITGDLSTITGTLSLLHQQYDFSTLTQLLPGALPTLIQAELQPLLNQYLQKGYALPSMSYVEFNNSVISIGSGIANIATDFNILKL